MVVGRLSKYISEARMPPHEPARTRTAEVLLNPDAEAKAREARGAGEQPASGLPHSQTEPLVEGQADSAAISFARGRERALLRAEHSATVRRLRLTLSIGWWVWSGTALLDLFITRYAGEGDLGWLLSLRAAGALALLAVLARLWRAPEPSARVLWLCDLAAFTAPAVFLSLMTLSYRGLGSPYAAGIIVVLVARGAMMLAPWQRGAWLSAMPALAYPVTIFVASRFDADLAAQLEEPATVGAFVTTLFLLALSWVMLVLGGHFAWRLSREAVSTRSIGRYELERKLGSGGMGDVWAAFDRTLRQRVALKTVYGQLPGSSVLARFEREVRALAELTHPNTVRVFDYGVTEDGLWYYAMELLRGEDLRALVAREGPLPAARLLRIAQQALRALGEAHGKGIIHRDIKPENVFVAELGGESDVVKLLDFGIAKATSSGDATLTNTGHIAGTAAYMAPELILGRPADARSDIYSFGVLLYHAASARLPFLDDDPASLLAAHLSRPPPPLGSLAPGPLPPLLEQVIHRCMAKDPALRPASTQEVLEALALASAALSVD